ncbi:MAG: PD40 domain-containing protein [Candidatus Riflebacteria bacterium]|nr:PD40 domain-containing protein [Candidatus Riflebacteria bacterium]
MYCYRCGQQLNRGLANCPSCDTPQKRKQRRRQKLFLGLFIFLSGALMGSFVDSFFFQGKTWDYSFIGKLKEVKDYASRNSDSASAPIHFSEKKEALALSEKLRREEKQLAGFAKKANKDLRLGITQQTAPIVSEVSNFSKSASPTTTAREAGIAQTFDNTAASSSPSPTFSSKSAPKSESELQTTTSVLLSEPASISKTAISSIASSSITASSASSTGSLQPSPNAESIQPPPSDQPEKKVDKRPFAFDKVKSLETGEGNYFHGSLSPDSKMLIFSGSRPEIEKGKLQVYIKEATREAPAVRLFPWPGNIWTPEFSNDGKSLVFSSDSQTPEQIFLYEKDTQKNLQLTMGDSKSMMPSLSPDGKFIAFVSNKKKSNNIWLIGTDGTGQVQITSGPNDDREPRWFPDQKAIVFTRIFEKFKDSRIMKVPLEPAGPPSELVGGKGRKWFPDISPDGKYLAYVQSGKNDGSENVILVRNLETGKEFTVAPFKDGEHFRPIWSPKGDGFVFHVDKSGKKSLYFAHLKRIGPP